MRQPGTCSGIRTADRPRRCTVIKPFGAVQAVQKSKSGAEARYDVFDRHSGCVMNQ